MLYTVPMNDLQLSENERPTPVKKYPFRFSALMLVLCVLGLVLSAAGIALTTWQFVRFLGGDLSSVYEWMKYILLYLVSILLAVLLTAMLICSQYVVTERQLIMQFGLIKQKYALKSVCAIHHARGAKKLVVYFDEYKSKYIMIVVKESWYDDFIKTLLERNPRIEFTFSTPEDEDVKKKK